ncbi:MAG TPA: MerR family transcriptional regulator, partial [Pseudomonadales bacterium]|nr:MerR family transcriptional regulator [Pseudomonadales bacterium]
MSPSHKVKHVNLSWSKLIFSAKLAVKCQSVNALTWTNQKMQPDDSVPGLPISSVERETGLSKDTLRVWERRYGFPTPERDANGERSYSLQQVRRLTQLKRLLDQGHRPGKLLKLDEEALSALLGTA